MKNFGGEYWGEEYNVAVQFRDWQTCDILHEKKGYLRDGFIAACEIKDKEIELLNSWVKHHQRTVEIKLAQNHQIEKENEILCGEIKTYRKMFEDQKEQLEKASELLGNLHGHGLAISQFPHKDKQDFECALSETRDYLKQLENNYEKDNRN